MTRSHVHKSSPRRTIAGVVAAVMLLALGARGAAGAPAQKKEPAQANPVAQPPATTRSIGAAQVSIDPATGKVRPQTPEEAAQLVKALQLMLRRNPEDLPVTLLRDGTLMVNLQDTFQEVAMATVGADGQVTVHCVNDAAQAMALLNGAGAETEAGAAPAVAARKKHANGAAAEK